MLNFDWIDMWLARINSLGKNNATFPNQLSSSMPGSGSTSQHRQFHPGHAKNSDTGVFDHSGSIGRVRFWLAFLQRRLEAFS